MMYDAYKIKLPMSKKLSVNNINIHNTHDYNFCVVNTMTINL